MGKLAGLLLILGLWAPEWCHCSDGGGRAIEGLEFPFTAHVRRQGKPEPLCMGVIYGSVTVISAAMCEKIFEKTPADVSQVQVEPSDNIYSKKPEATDLYPVNEGHKDVRKEKFKLCYTVLTLEMPGIMLESGRPGRSPLETNKTEEPFVVEELKILKQPERKAALMNLVMPASQERESGRYGRRAQDPAADAAKTTAAAAAAGGDASKPPDAATGGPPAAGGDALGQASGNDTGGGGGPISAAAKFIPPAEAKTLTGDAVVPCADKKVVGVKIMAADACKAAFEKHVKPAPKPRRHKRDEAGVPNETLEMQELVGGRYGRRAQDPAADAAKTTAAAAGGDASKPPDAAGGATTGAGPPAAGGDTPALGQAAGADFKDETFDPNMICVQKAAAEVALGGGKGVPPGLPCAGDVGAPLVRTKDKVVMGVLLYAWCAKTADDMAIFVTTLEEDSVAQVPTEAGGGPSTITPDRKTNPPGPPPGPAPAPAPKTTPRGTASSITPLSLLTTLALTAIISNILNAGQ